MLASKEKQDQRDTPSSLNRRNVLIFGGSVLLAAGIGGTALWVYSPRMLVANAGTGVIHHKALCADHLPWGKNCRTPLDTDSYHEGLKTRIFEAIAMDLSSADRLSFLRIATQSEPMSLRLIDLAVNTMQELEMFADIVPFLEFQRSEVERRVPIESRKAILQKRERTIGKLLTRIEFCRMTNEQRLSIF